MKTFTRFFIGFNILLLLISFYQHRFRSGASNMLITVEKILKEHDQLHLLKCYNELNQEDQQVLLESISSLDFARVEEMYSKYKNSKDVADKLDDLVKPVPNEAYASISTCSKDDKELWVNTGLAEIADSKVGVILMAGGQGTRLGVPYPKGMYNVKMPSQKSLYHIKAERLLKLQKLAMEKTDKEGSITWYIMTSEATMGQTVEYFKKNDFFGLKESNVKFFEQFTLPCMDFNGKVLLSAKNKVAQSPDGNGGLYRALVNRGILADMISRKIEHIHVVGVDNILTKIADPAFIGLSKIKGADCGAKVVHKSSPNEAVGVVCKVDDHFQVVEYSEVSHQTSHKTDKDGNLIFNSGNICNHYFTVQFLTKVCNDEKDLPLHIAKKKIPFVNDENELTKPTQPNGIKMEKFVFDVFKYSKSFIVMDVPREDEFAPLKNADGAANSTPLDSRKSLTYLHHRWLVDAGAVVCRPNGEVYNPPTSLSEVDGEYPVVVEISPMVSYGGEGLEKYSGQRLTSPIHLH